MTADDFRRAMLAAALEEWASVVRDDDKGKPGDRDVIARYFYATGWGPWLEGVTGGAGYRETKQTSWCGQFVGAMGLRLGRFLLDGVCAAASLDYHVAHFVMPSTERLASRNKWRAAGVSMPVFYSASVNARQVRRSSDGRLVDVDGALTPGVVATFKTSGNKPLLGDHIVIVERYDAEKGVVYTVEGNGRGELGNGERGEGVVRAVRKIEDLRRLYPLELEHFEVW